MARFHFHLEMLSFASLLLSSTSLTIVILCSRFQMVYISSNFVEINTKGIAKILKHYGKNKGSENSHIYKVMTS